jgi:hypothetical protein
VCCVIDRDVIIESLNFPRVELDSGILTVISPPSDSQMLPSPCRKRSNRRYTDVISLS